LIFLLVKLVLKKNKEKQRETNEQDDKEKLRTNEQDDKEKQREQMNK
jgi:hypothetical protein